MAWNQTTNNYSKKPAGGKKLSPVMKGGLALILIWALGSLVWWFVAASGPEQPVENVPQKPAGQLEVVEAAKAGEVKETPKPLKFWEVDASQTNGFTVMQQRKWRHAHRPPPGYTNDTARTEPPPAYAIFDHHSENTIAGYLTMTPGETLVGTPHYGPMFTKDFMESLQDPIVITSDDTPEQAELKQLMIETKKELKDRIDNGEDLGRILLDTHEEYQRLAMLKADIMQEFVKFRKNSDATVQDVEDFLTAANRVLEEKGVAPITLSPIAKRMLLRRQGD